MALALSALNEAARTITDQPTRPGDLTRRQGIVGPVDYVNMTAVVSIGGSTNLVTARWLAPYVPVYLDGVWILMADGEPLILGPTGPPRPLGAAARRTTAQTITNESVGSWQSLIFDDNYSGARDRGGLWNIANPSRLTIPIAGRWFAAFHVQWDTNATGNRIARFLVNGATQYGGSSELAVSGTHNSRTELVRELTLGVGDYLEAQLWQDSGASRTTTTGENTPELTITYDGTY